MGFRALVTLTLGLAWVPRSQGVTLTELFKKAKESKASQHMARTRVKVSKHQERQAVGEIMPRLSVDSSHRLRQSEANASGRQLASSQGDLSLSLSQAVFRGGREYYGLKKAELGVEISGLQLLVEERRLYAELAAAFYRLFARQGELELLREQRGLLAERVRILRQWLSIGKSRPAEVLLTQSEETRVAADLLSLEGSLEEEKTKLAILAGVERIERVDDTDDAQRLFDDSIELPEITELRKRLEHAQQEIRYQRGNYLPSVDLSGRYYIKQTSPTYPTKWEALLSLKWEVFSGLKDYHAIKIAAEKESAISYKLGEARREQNLRLNRARKSLEDKKRLLVKREAAVRIAESYYQANQADYEKRLVSNLDVVRSLEQLLSRKRDLLATELELHLAQVDLRLLSGRLL